MIRVSHQELVERWTQTYQDEGFTVRAVGVTGIEPPNATNGVQPDIEAANGDEKIFVQIIDSPEELAGPNVRQTTQRLAEARGNKHALHLVVAAECMLQLNGALAEWNVEPDLVHVT